MFIPFTDCINHAKTSFKGVIHIGAHLGEECESYRNSGVESIIWIEANPDLMDSLKKRTQFVSPNIDQKYYCCLMAATTDEEKDFYVTNNGQSSSMLQLGTHKDHYPHIVVTETQKLKTLRFDDLVKKESIDFSKYDFINLDIQGAELQALKGFGDLLKSKNLKAIYCEVNYEELYIGAALYNELAEFLNGFGFKPVATADTPQKWGDCLFVR